jgi:hypothetical protein
LWASLSSGTQGCSSGFSGPELEGIYGTWDWIRAVGGIAGREITPESEGYTMTVRFLDDNVAELERDGQLQVRTRFVLLLGEGFGGEVAPDLIRYDSPLLGWEEQSIGLDGADRLILIDDCCDGFTYEFMRVPE